MRDASGLNHEELIPQAAVKQGGQNLRATLQSRSQEGMWSIAKKQHVHTLLKFELKKYCAFSYGVGGEIFHRERR